MIEAFNQRLVKYSHRLTQLRLLRNQLVNSYHTLFDLLMSADKEAKGGLTSQQVSGLWANNLSSKPADFKEFIEYLFPFPLISYSALASFLVDHLPEQKSSKENLGSVALSDKISEILSLQYFNFVEGRIIGQNLEKYIPTLYLKPTKKQFQEYVISQQLGLDIDAVSRGLQLPELPAPFHHSKLSEEMPETLNQQTVRKLAATMDRLKQRVRNFGAEWID